VTRLTAAEGDVVPVGEPLGYVDATDEDGLGDLDELH
jgi:pyruvate/2-oxoglutarate dehydrogenase complex dihydrolipoamide acyltransferase (E2) component